jgi:hypothetical protein
MAGKIEGLGKLMMYLKKHGSALGAAGGSLLEAGGKAAGEGLKHGGKFVGEAGAEGVKKIGQGMQKAGGMALKHPKIAGAGLLGGAAGADYLMDDDDEELEELRRALAQHGGGY